MWAITLFVQQDPLICLQGLLSSETGNERLSPDSSSQGRLSVVIFQNRISGPGHHIPDMRVYGNLRAAASSFRVTDRSGIIGDSRFF